MTDKHSIIRVNLPSGGWWEFQSRPLWKHIRQWTSECHDQPGGVGFIEPALVAITTAWSFGEVVSLQALERREVEDLIATIETFQREVLSSLDMGSQKEMAEKLFVSLLIGQLPHQFAEAHVMAATGWSWQTLQETPFDVVRNMMTYLAVAQAIESKSNLNFPGTEEEQDGG